MDRGTSRRDPAGVPPTYRGVQPPSNGRIPAAIGLVVLVLATAPASVVGALLQLATDGCRPDTCNKDLTAASFLVASIGPVLVLGGALLITIPMVVRKVRTAFVVPLVGLVLDVVCLGGGYFLMYLGAAV